MRPIDADSYMEKVEREAGAMPLEKGEEFLTLTSWIMDKTPAVETKEVRYFDEDEKVWKIGRVIVDAS